MTDTISAEPLQIVSTDARKTRYYSEERKAEIKAILIEAIAQGTPEAVALRDSPNMPDVAAIWKWRQDDEAFAQSIAQARNLGWDAIANDLRAVARGETGSTDDVQRDKLIIETDLKLLSKWDKRYADKIQHEVHAKVLVAKVDATLTPEDASEAYKQLMG